LVIFRKKKPRSQRGFLPTEGKFSQSSSSEEVLAPLIPSENQILQHLVATVADELQHIECSSPLEEGNKNTN
jgi:hypothetical protein